MISLEKMLRRGPFSVKELAEKRKTTTRKIREGLKELQVQGYYILKTGTSYSIPPTQANPKVRYQHTVSDDNVLVFGICSDQHLCSKYERLDVLNHIYDTFAANGIRTVYNAGNWIDGYIPRINAHDVKHHSMAKQIDYLIKNYPKRDGIVTYAVSGDDHEGWYAKDIGLDIGKYTEREMKDSGREDWIDLGFMESYVDIVNPNSNKTGSILVMHPGGGSSYAISYRPQKIVESLDDRPDILILGHYHKMSYNLIQDVHVIQAGCTQDQSPFMRKKTLAAHVGGWIVKAIQDPKTGKLKTVMVQGLFYGPKGRKNNRWNYEGEVNLIDRI